MSWKHANANRDHQRSASTALARMVHARIRTRPNKNVFALRQALSRVACDVVEWEAEIWDEVTETANWFNACVRLRNSDRLFYIDAPYSRKAGGGTPKHIRLIYERKAALCTRKGLPYLKLGTTNPQEMELAIRIWLRELAKEGR